LAVNARRRKRRKNARILSQLWLPVAILVVAAVVGYGVNKVRHMSEAISNPPAAPTIPATIVQINPKNVTYEVFGDLGGGGKVVYADLKSNPVEVRLTSLPWSHSETTMASSATLSLVVQVDGSSVGCRIRVNGELRDEHSVSHESAAVACTVTAA
jgi:Mycobacterium membrane protein